MSSTPRRTSADTTKAVDAFMLSLDHPFKAEMESLRRSILDVETRLRVDREAVDHLRSADSDVPSRAR